MNYSTIKRDNLTFKKLRCLLALSVVCKMKFNKYFVVKNET